MFQGLLVIFFAFTSMNAFTQEEIVSYDCELKGVIDIGAEKGGDGLKKSPMTLTFKREKNWKNVNLDNQIMAPNFASSGFLSIYSVGTPGTISGGLIKNGSRLDGFHWISFVAAWAMETRINLIETPQEEYASGHMSHDGRTYFLNCLRAQS